MKKQDVYYYVIVAVVFLAYFLICYRTTTSGRINFVTPYACLAVALTVLSVAHKKLMRYS